MKIPYSYILVAGILLAGGTIATACSNSSVNEASVKEKVTDKKPDGIVNVEANYIKYNEEDDLFKDAELVVIAKADKNFKDRDHVITYFDDSSDPQQPKVIEDFYTKTSISIKKVLKQSEGSDYTKKSTINILEPISLNQTKDGEQIITTENYIEMEKGKKYVLFLKKNGNGEYSIINMNNGKFNLDIDNEFDMKKIDQHDKETHEKIKKTIKQKFKKEIEESDKL